MKKEICLIMAVVILTLFVACQKENVNYTAGDSTAMNVAIESANVEKWFDFSDSKIDWNKHLKTSVEKIPNVEFRCDYENLIAIENGKEQKLYTAWPIKSVYFFDLTGDGCPELCLGASIGSGIVDQRIIVYDYAEKEIYELCERGEYDYTLELRGDALYAVKTKMYDDEQISSDRLIMQIAIDGTKYLSMGISEKNPIKLS